VRTVLDRPGWFIPRDAFGPDLYDIGRDAVVRVGGRDVRAGDQLAETWAAVRPVSVEVSDSSELDVVDAQVEGRSPIPLEALSPPDAAAPAGALTSSFARLHARHRDGLSVTVASLSWAAVAFDVRMPSRACHVVVPRRWLDSFLRCVDDGTITTTLASSAADERPSAGPYVVTGPFRPDAVLPAEPRARTPWWRHRRAELVGIAAGAVATLAALAATRW
jgi:hypothetical protein